MSDTRFSGKRIGLGLLLLAAVLGLLVTTTQVSVAQTLTTLYSFEGGVNGKQYLKRCSTTSPGAQMGLTLWGAWSRTDTAIYMA